jgi:hypothetical protein
MWTAKYQTGVTRPLRVLQRDHPGLLTCRNTGVSGCPRGDTLHAHTAAAPVRGTYAHACAAAQSWGAPLLRTRADPLTGHLCWVMPGLVGASYGRVAAEEAAMAQQSPGPASNTGPAAAPGMSGCSPRSSRYSGRSSGSGSLSAPAPPSGSAPCRPERVTGPGLPGRSRESVVGCLGRPQLPAACCHAGASAVGGTRWLDGPLGGT